MNNQPFYKPQINLSYKTSTLFQTLCIILTCLILLSPQQGHAQISILWSEGEHLELGQMGAMLACQNLKMNLNDCPIVDIPRQDKKAKFKYGELVTLADYYNSPHELWSDKKRRLDRLIKCAYKQISVHDDQERAPSSLNPQSVTTNEASVSESDLEIVDDGTQDPILNYGDEVSDDLNKPDHLISASHLEYPDCNAVGFISKPSYIEIITKNYAHFGWNSMKAYIEYHTLALELAKNSYLIDQKKSKTKKDLATSTELFYQALVVNAFADHYLTDSFASGHVRTPRIQIKLWADKKLSGFLKKTRGDLLSMALHDAESRNLVSDEEQGLQVQNSLGEVWRTRSDKKLHHNSYAGDPTLMKPLNAVSMSFQELLIAKRSGKIQNGIFNASFYVPFAVDIPLKDKLTPEYHKMKQQDFLRSILSSLPTFIRWIFPKSDLEKMLTDFDEIMGQFRLDVEADIQKNPILQQRLPEYYLNEFKNVE